MAGVPEIVPVPSPLSLKATPDGRAPVSLSAALGSPVVLNGEAERRPRCGRGGVGTGNAGRLGYNAQDEDRVGTAHIVGRR